MDNQFTKSIPRAIAAIVAAALLAMVMLTWVDAAQAATPELNNPNGDKVCQPKDTHIDGKDRKVITETIQDGLLITGYCVKSGSVKNGQGPHYVTLDAPAKTVEITHPSGKDISHYTVLWIPEPVEPPFDHNWQYEDPTCEWLHVEYPANLPNPQNANHVNIRISSNGQTITLNWHTSGTWAPASTFVYADHIDWPGWEQYTVEWVQVAETNYHWSGSLECGTPPQLAEVFMTHASECEAGVMFAADNVGTMNLLAAVSINGDVYRGGMTILPGESLSVTVPHDMLVAGDEVELEVLIPFDDTSLGGIVVNYVGDCPLPPPPVFECEDGMLVEDLDDCPPPVTVPPETTVPETTVPETTVPETTVPETTVPETTVPETTVPEVQDELPKTGAKTDLLVVAMWLTAAGLLLYGTSRSKRTEK